MGNQGEGRLAARLRQIFRDRGYDFRPETYTNQIFPVLPAAMIPALREKVRFEPWEKLDEKRTVVRFVTSWSTTEADPDYLERVL